MTQGHYCHYGCEPNIPVHGSGAVALRPSYRLQVEGSRAASGLAPEQYYTHHWPRSRIDSVVTMAQPPEKGATAQPTHIAQQFAHMIHQQHQDRTGYNKE